MARFDSLNVGDLFRFDTNQTNIVYVKISESKASNFGSFMNVSGECPVTALNADTESAMYRYTISMIAAAVLGTVGENIPPVGSSKEAFASWLSENL
tara:strand:+ start:434 stop:724 length:291 start_codon:yes stop_codon:yes gene_type:complete